MILVCLNYVIAKNKPTAGFLLRPPEGRFSLSVILSHQNTFDSGRGASLGEETHFISGLSLSQYLVEKERKLRYVNRFSTSKFG